MKNLSIALFVLSQACMAIAGKNELPKDYDAAAVVAAVVRLHAVANKNWPEHLMRDSPVRNRKEFDVAKYFEVLKHVSAPEGQVLDYVYSYSGGNGSPHLYLRAIDAAPFRTCNEYEKSLGGWEKAYEAQRNLFIQLRLDGSSESFFEQFVFDKLAGQFYLAWHANYNDSTIVTTTNEMERIIAEIDKDDFGTPLTAEQKTAARKADLAPLVEWSDDKVAEVSIVLFSKWGGLYRITRRVARTYPHAVEKTEIEKLVQYNCGMMF